ncbi:MAG: HAMP domain-containing histidine kinase [Sphaerochaetaceae bacterium]|nr:HAMP domain-containing histidine kinase [Sphaerochaetaceae bacterium]
MRRLRDLKVIEETQKNIRRRWKFIEGKERLFVYAGLGLAFVMSMVLIFIIYNGMIERYQLQMKFDSEKSFNSVYLALTDSPNKARTAMADEGVSGIGIYSTSGQSYQVLGDAPMTLPISRLVRSRQRGEDSTLGVYVMDSDSRMVEYFRLSRLNVVLDTGMLFSNLTNPVSVSDFPEIIYIKFDGSQYFANVFKARVIALLSIALVLSLLLMIISIYNNNRKYRVQLQKNEGLAKIGSAARTLTHEIKNPLSAMTIQSALLKKLLPKEFHADMEVMDQEIARLTSLTNRVSEFLKNPTGTPEDIELVGFITNISKLFAYPVAVSHENLSEVHVRFDADRARSVFENLMKNAIESCQDRDPQVSVEIKASRHKTVTIKVMDRGDGLPRQARDKLFDPFYTTKIHGSGIGLAISKQFVEAQGGSLKLSDRDGGGTVAEVVLPCKG